MPSRPINWANCHVWFTFSPEHSIEHIYQANGIVTMNTVLQLQPRLLFMKIFNLVRCLPLFVNYYTSSPKLENNWFFSDCSTIHETIVAEAGASVCRYCLRPTEYIINGPFFNRVRVKIVLKLPEVCSTMVLYLFYRKFTTTDDVQE